MPCKLGTRTYPENATVCSPDGWVLQCSNGEWIDTPQRCIPHANAPVDAAFEVRTLVTPKASKKKTDSAIKGAAGTKAKKRTAAKTTNKAGASEEAGGSKGRPKRK